MQETQVPSLGWEDPLENGMVPHSSILAWEIPKTEEPGGYSPWDPKELDTNEAIELTYTHHKYLLLQSEAVYKIISSVQLLSCV